MPATLSMATAAATAAAWVPDLPSPPPRSLEARAVVTGLVLLVYCAAGEVGLWGAAAGSEGSTDAFQGARRGRLLDLGLGPLFSASLLLQLAFAGQPPAAAGDRVRERLAKAAALAWGGVQACEAVRAGHYGGDLSGWVQAAVALQLTAGLGLVLALDEALSRGYGIGAGTTLFTSAAWSGQLVRSLLWPSWDGAAYEGALPELARYALAGGAPGPLLAKAASLLGTAALVALAVQAHCTHVRVPLRRKGGGAVEPLTVRLLHTSSTPIMLYEVVASNLEFVAGAAATRYGGGDAGAAAASVAGGLEYALRPPPGGLLADPTRFAAHGAALLAACGGLSVAWAKVSRTTPHDLFEQVGRQKCHVPGYRDCTGLQVLERYVAPATVASGLTVAGLTLLADAVSTVGSGTGIMLGVVGVLEYCELARGLTAHRVLPRGLAPAADATLPRPPPRRVRRSQVAE
jgi:protein transport protein SEC61 subunit alpha